MGTWAFVGERRPPRTLGAPVVLRPVRAKVATGATTPTPTSPGGPASTTPPPAPTPDTTVGIVLRMAVAGILVGALPGAGVGWLLGHTLVGAAGGAAAGGVIVGSVGWVGEAFRTG